MPKFNVHCVVKTTKHIGDFEAETKEKAKMNALKEAYVVFGDCDEDYEIDKLIIEEIKED